MDYQPFDWVSAPPGTNIAMGYYQFGSHNEFHNSISGAVKGRTGLDSHVGIARYLHYEEALGHPYVLDFILPFGTLTNGKIGGARLSDASGIADPILSLGVWLVNQPNEKRYLSAVSFLSLPLGSYTKGRVLNLGANRWQHDFQVDFTQGFLDKFTVDISGDWTYYGDNTKAGAGSQTLSQNATFGAYLWLSYDVTSVVQEAMLPAARQANVSIGYAGTFGGAQRLDGVRTGAKTEQQQIRLTYSQFVAPTWQVLLSVSHDVAVSGQFKQDLGLLFRVAKLF